ncbi:MAG: acyltransferase [Candidatus Wenzhouxiangella sp. M2_3B_020]
MSAGIQRAARVSLATLLLSLNTVVHVLPLLVVALVKAIVRLGPARRLCDWTLMRIAESWIGFNSWMFEHLTRTRIVVDGMPDVDRLGHYLVISNHQSWVDIPVLQKLFNRRLPLLRFFLKSQLIWVPLLGLAWWALDFPFMKRYSRETLAKRPELAGRDVEATRRACRKFKDVPVAVMNFVEGTRFTPSKRDAQESTYRHLLRPRAGGVGLVLEAMGDVLDTVIDVAIVYSEPRPALGELFANRIREIRVSIRTLPVPESLREPEAVEADEYRQRVRDWINGIWRDKDRRIASMREELDDAG